MSEVVTQSENGKDAYYTRPEGGTYKGDLFRFYFIRKDGIIGGSVIQDGKKLPGVKYIGRSNFSEEFLKAVGAKPATARSTKSYDDILSKFEKPAEEIE